MGIDRDGLDWDFDGEKQRLLVSRCPLGQPKPDDLRMEDGLLPKRRRRGPRVKREGSIMLLGSCVEQVG